MSPWRRNNGCPLRPWNASIELATSMSEDSRVPPAQPTQRNPFASPLGMEEDDSALPHSYQGRPLNAWLSIWTRPRATIRQIVATNSPRRVLVLAALSGDLRDTRPGVSRNAGDTLPLFAILATAAVGGSVVGVFGLYVSAWILRFASRQLGGIATAKQIRCANRLGPRPSDSG